MNPSFIVRLLSACCLLFSPLVAGAATAATPANSAIGDGVITGRIFNPATGEYVRNAQVRLDDAGQVVASSSDGEFSLTSVGPGKHTLVVSYTGYQTVTTTVEVAAGATVTRNFDLVSLLQAGADPGRAVQLEAVVVSSQREGNAKAIMDQRHSMNITNTVSSDVFGDDGEGNVAEFLKHLPGVNTEGAFGEPRNVGLRGLGSEYTAVTVDGQALSSADPTAQGAGTSRSFTFENASLSSMDSIEVSKTVSADMDANAPAGTINLRTKRAFERPGRRIAWQANLAGHSTALSLGRSPGPGEGNTRKLLPGGLLEYSDIFLQHRLGIVVSVSESNIFQEADSFTLTYDRNATAADPRPAVISQMTINQSLRFNERFAATLNADFKATDNLVLSLSAIYNWTELWSPQRNVVVTAGARASVIGADPLVSFTTNSTTALVAGRPSTIDKLGRTMTLLPRFEYKWRGLIVEGRSVYSRSYTWYDPMGHRGAINSLNGPSHTGIKYQAERASANAYDWKITQLAGPDWAGGYTNIVPAIINDFRHSNHNIYGGEIAATLKTNPGLPVEWKTGVKTQYELYTYGTQVNSSIYAYTPNGTSIGFNSFPSAVDFSQKLMNTTLTSLSGGGTFMPNLEAIGHLFQAHPEQFTNTATVAQWTTVNITSPRHYEETVDAAYLMATAKAGRASFRAGLRWEQTGGDAAMFNKRTDAEVRAAGYVLAASGDANTVPGLIYQYLSLPKLHQTKQYDDFFPSAAFKYTLSTNLDFNFGYSRTIRRPAFKDVAGVFAVNDQTLTVATPNIRLQPETSNNLSARLGYYFEPVGILALNLFQNDVRNLMISNSVSAQQFGYTGPEDLAAYTFNTTTNSPGTTKIRGLELEYAQSLSFLPGALKGLGVRASYTYNRAQVTLPGLVRHQASTGVNYTLRRFNATVNALWSDNVPTTDDGTSYRRHRATLDANLGYRLTRRTSVFLSGRNLTNTRDVTMDHFAPSPAVWRANSLYGATYTAGIKGSF